MSNTMSDKNSVNFTRREFLGTVAAAAAFTIVPRSVLGGPGYTAPSDMVNLAGIGVGSQGGGDIQNIATPDVPIKRRPFWWRRYADATLCGHPATQTGTKSVG